MSFIQDVIGADRRGDPPLQVRLNPYASSAFSVMLTKRDILESLRYEEVHDSDEDVGGRYARSDLQGCM